MRTVPVHHSPTLGQVLRAVVSLPDFVGLAVRELPLDGVAGPHAGLVEDCRGDRAKAVAGHTPAITEAIEGEQQRVLADGRLGLEWRGEDVRAIVRHRPQSIEQGADVARDRNDVWKSGLHALAGDDPDVILELSPAGANEFRRADEGVCHQEKPCARDEFRIAAHVAQEGWELGRRHRRNVLLLGLRQHAGETCSRVRFDVTMVDGVVKDRSDALPNSVRGLDGPALGDCLDDVHQVAPPDVRELLGCEIGQHVVADALLDRPLVLGVRELGQLPLQPALGRLAERQPAATCRKLLLAPAGPRDRLTPGPERLRLTVPADIDVRSPALSVRNDGRQCVIPRACVVLLRKPSSLGVWFRMPPSDTTGDDIQQNKVKCLATSDFQCHDETFLGGAGGNPTTHESRRAQGWSA